MTLRKSSYSLHRFFFFFNFSGKKKKAIISHLSGCKASEAVPLPAKPPHDGDSLRNTMLQVWEQCISCNLDIQGAWLPGLRERGCWRQPELHVSWEESITYWTTTKSLRFIPLNHPVPSQLYFTSKMQILYTYRCIYNTCKYTHI